MAPRDAQGLAALALFPSVLRANVSPSGLEPPDPKTRVFWEPQPQGRVDKAAVGLQSSGKCPTWGECLSLSLSLSVCVCVCVYALGCVLWEACLRCSVSAARLVGGKVVSPRPRGGGRENGERSQEVLQNDRRVALIAMSFTCFGAKKKKQSLRGCLRGGGGWKNFRRRISRHLQHPLLVGFLLHTIRHQLSAQPPPSSPQSYGCVAYRGGGLGTARECCGFTGNALRLPSRSTRCSGSTACAHSTLGNEGCKGPRLHRHQEQHH